MAELLGLETIDEIINDFVGQFGLDAELDNDFSSYIEDDLIGYPLVMIDAADKYFIPFTRNLAPDVDIDIYIVSLMHEVGHIFTREQFDDEAWQADCDAKNRIDAGMALLKNDEESVEALYNEYFNLPDEKAATLWGLNYIRNNFEEISAFWSRLQAAIMNFYQMNGVI